MSAAEKAKDAYTATVTEDLLRVVKVAMPEDLFAIDPRVIKARALLARLTGKVQ